MSLSKAHRAIIIAAQKARWTEHRKKTDLAKSGTGSSALLDMSPPQIAVAFNKLTLVEESCEKLSGICATLKGLLLHEAKHKLEHGQFLPWLKKNFPKSHKTATLHMRLAVEFSKCEPKFTFDALERDLGSTLEVLEENRLDLKNPVVAEVARWTEGRSRYQLLLDLGEARRGGHHPRKNAPLSAEEKLKQEHDDAWETWTHHEGMVSAYAFGNAALKPNWEPLSVAELSQLQKSFYRVAQLFDQTIKARKGLA